MPDSSKLGGQVGRKLAGIVADSTIATRARTSLITHNLAMQIQHSFFDLVGTEIHSTLGPLFAQIAESEDTPKWAQKTFSDLATKKGQWFAFLASQLSGAAIGTGLGSLLTNELAPAVQRVLEANPNSLLSTADLATLATRGILSNADAELESRRQGVSSDRMKWLIEAAYNDIDPSSAIDALNRGVISEGRVKTSLRRHGIRSDAQDALIALGRMEISPQELASLVTFGAISESEASGIAKRSGMTSGDFKLLVRGNGQPPGVQDLLFAYRRGIINKSRLLRGIEQGPVRNEWFDVVESLGSVPPSTADAISAAVQGHISKNEAEGIARQNGLETKYFSALYETAGEPLSPTAMIELWQRGDVSRSQVEQALRESRYKDKYIPHFLKLKLRIPPQDTVRMMLSNGVIDNTQATKYLSQLGYDKTVITAFIKTASIQKTQGARALTESTMRTLYESRAISKSIYAEMLLELGYDKQEIEWLTAISDLRIKNSQRNNALTRIRTAYIARRITENQAQGEMDSLLIPADMRDDLLATWDVSRDVETKLLSKTDVEHALKAGLITANDAVKRWEQLGYTPDDAQIILKLNQPQT